MTLSQPDVPPTVFQQAELFSGQHAQALRLYRTLADADADAGDAEAQYALASEGHATE